MDTQQPNNPRITAEVIREYEKVRASGLSNMYDVLGVLGAANKLRCYALAEVIVADIRNHPADHSKPMFPTYVEILKFFSFYMSKYGVTQTPAKKEHQPKPKKGATQ